MEAVQIVHLDYMAQRNARRQVLTLTGVYPKAFKNMNVFKGCD